MAADARHCSSAAQDEQRDLFEEFDPYSVRPEDALEAARREVKQWRMEQLATVKRQHHLDALTEWYVLAWDAFRAPRFPADEALKLARVVGLDFDQDVKKKVCEIKGDDVILWDSVTRHRTGSLGHVSEGCMLDTLHWAAKTAREQNTEEDASQDETSDEVMSGDEVACLAAEAPEAIDERDRINDLLRRIAQLGTDSKARRLKVELDACLADGFDSMIVFTQYTDTMEYLRDYLADQMAGMPVACYSGAGGAWRDASGQWVPCSKEEIKRRLRDRQVRLLVCTDAAGEGLNLQFAACW
jgi:hypothetical protein